MRTISDIYSEYKIMKSLQSHMLRVAAVASVLCDNMSIELDKGLIVSATLLHDMGNIIKSNLDFFPDFLEPEGKEYWQGVKTEYMNRYGSNEHVATMEIAKELNVSEAILNILEKISFKMLCEHAAGQDFYIKIAQYADMRVGPYGVLSYKDRMKEGMERYKNRKDYADRVQDDAEKLQLFNCGFTIENQIFENCKLRPEDINDESIAPIIEELRGYVIK